MAHRRKKGPGGSKLLKFPVVKRPVTQILMVEESPPAKDSPAETDNPEKTFKTLMRKRAYADAAKFAQEQGMAGDAKRAARLWIAKLIETAPHEAVIFARASGLPDEFGISLKRFFEWLIKSGLFDRARILAEVYSFSQPIIIPNATVPISLKQIAESVAEEYEADGKELEAARVRKEFGV